MCVQVKQFAEHRNAAVQLVSALMSFYGLAFHAPLNCENHVLFKDELSQTKSVARVAVLAF